MHIKNFILIVGLGFVLLLGGCSDKNTSAKENKQDLVPVNVQQVKKGTITKSLVYAGKVKPLESVSVTCKTPGKVEKVYFDVGDRVQKGDVLFTLDQEDIKNQISSLESQLKTSQINIDIAETTLESTKGGKLESQLNQAKTNLNQAQLNYKDARENYYDTKQLYDSGAISKQQYDKTKSAYDKAKLAYESAKESYNLTKNKISKENIKSAEERLKQAKASKDSLSVKLQNAKESLENTIIKSPISGIVSSRMIDEGEMAGTNAVPFTIVDINKVLINVDVSEQIINKLSEGQKVKLFISSASDQAFIGRITSISPAANERTLTYPVKIEVSNKNNMLKPGMFAQVHLNVEKKEEVIVVPRSAVLSQGDTEYVFIEQKNCAKRKEVKTGLDNGKKIEILEGIKPGQSIIVKGQNYVSDGSKVKIISNSDGEV